MAIILSQDVPKLGKTGEVVKVREGYARNFLIPRKMAWVATPANLKKIDQMEKKRKAQDERQKADAEQLAEKLNKLSCTVSVEVNDLDRLYGAVTETDIIKAIEAEGFNVDRRQIIIEKPIEELGIFEIGVKLHPEVTAKIRLWVTKK